MIEALIAVLAFFGGMAAHQTEPLLLQFPRRWELLSRYIVGVLVVDLFTLAMIRKMNPRAVRDFVAASTVINMAVGLGVGVGHLIVDGRG